MKRLLYFTVFVSPMAASVLSFETPIGRMSLFRMAIFVALIFLFIPPLSGKIKYSLYTKKNKYSLSFMAFWLLYAILTIIWSNDYSSWLKYVFFLFIGLITMFLFNNYFSDIEYIKRAFQALFFGISLQALIGWYEIISGKYLFGFEEGNYNIEKALRIPIAMCGNSNDFATLMFLGIYVSYICFVCTRSKLLKILYFVVIINDVILLILTTSRSAIIGLLLSFVFILFLCRRKKIVAIVAVFVSVLIFPQLVIFFMEHLHFNFANPGSESYRINLIKNGFIMLLNSFWFGVGAGQTEYWLKIGMPYNTGGIMLLHNWWMEILSSYGVIIFVEYVIFYAKLFLSSFRSYKISVDKGTSIIGLSISAFMFGYSVTSLGSSSNMTSEYLWVFWAICIAYQGLNDNCSASVSKGNKTSIYTKLYSDNSIQL